MLVITCPSNVHALGLVNSEAAREIGEATRLSRGGGRSVLPSAFGQGVARGFVSCRGTAVIPFESAHLSQSLVYHITAERSATKGIRS